MQPKISKKQVWLTAIPCCCHHIVCQSRRCSVSTVLKQIFFNTAIRRSPESGAQKVVLGRLGELPFNVESKKIRRQLSKIIDASSQIPYSDISLNRSRSIVVPGQIFFNGIPSPAMIAAGATVFSVALKPICDLVNGYIVPQAVTA